MAASFLLAGVSLPLIRTVVSQVQEIVPQWTPPLPAEAGDAASRALRAEPHVLAVRRTFNALADRADRLPDLASLRRADGSNGLWNYLEVLILLRQQASSAPGHAGETSEQVPAVLRRIPSDLQPRVYIDRQRRILDSAFRAAGVSARRAAIEADRIRFYAPGLRESHRPVLRELTARLLATADAWQDTGRVGDALAARAAVVRLMTDLVAESPTADMALLASETLPRALQALGTAGQSAARDVESLRERWHSTAESAPVNLLPHTGDVVPARAAHDRALRSLAAAVVAVGMWIGWAVQGVAWLLIAALTRVPAEARPAWRWRGWARYLAPVVGCAPLVTAAAILALADIPFMWVLSLRTLPTVGFLPVWLPAAGFALAGMVLTTALAVRLCVARPRAGATSARRSAAVWATVAVLLGAVLVGVALWPVDDHPWSPPAGVQRFRRLAVVLGVEMAVGLPAWLAAWWLQRRRGRGLPASAWARAALGVTASSLLAASVVSAVALGINQYVDRQHERAFAVAAADPLADRLGPRWWDDHFERARSVLEPIQPSR